MRAFRVELSDNGVFHRSKLAPSFDAEKQHVAGRRRHHDAGGVPQTDGPKQVAIQRIVLQLVVRIDVALSEKALIAGRDPTAGTLAARIKLTGDERLHSQAHAL